MLQERRHRGEHRGQRVVDRCVHLRKDSDSTDEVSSMARKRLAEIVRVEIRGGSWPDIQQLAHSSNDRYVDSELYSGRNFIKAMSMHLHLCGGQDAGGAALRHEYAAGRQLRLHHRLVELLGV